MVVERGGDLGTARAGVAVEQCLRLDDDAGQAVAALAGLLVEERKLERMWFGGSAEAFDGGDRSAGNGANLTRAGVDRGAVDQHHATAALLEATAVARAFEIELGAQ